MTSIELLKLQDKNSASWNELFYELVSLSYKGDIRMFLGIEQKDKIDGIVNGQFEKLKDIYKPIANEHGVLIGDNGLDLNYINSKHIISDRINIKVPVTSYSDLLGVISKINKRTSIKMAISQFVAGHPVKNVKL